MSLADYLAKNYLTADPAPGKKSKKRKRKNAESSGLVIADDDSLGWTSGPVAKDDEDTAATVSGRTSEFRKSKDSSWKTVGSIAPSNADQAAADAIIASAAADRERAAARAEDAPQIVDDEGIVKMSSGAHAGLQTADQVHAQLAKQQAKEKAEMEALGQLGPGSKAQETIYRDASGRIINVAMKRAEARRKLEEEERKKEEEREAAKGDVQMLEKEKRRKQLADAKYMTVARYADDKELNEEMKERERWNDPAMQFLTKKKGKKSATGKPLYQGAAPPNRYQIRPGHRWDGVDRSNGFEKEWFMARNRKASARELEYAWQMDE